MSRLPSLSPELHPFPLPSELEDISYVDLSARARKRFDRDTIRVPLQVVETFSHGSNTVMTMLTNQLPGDRFKYLSAWNTIAELREAGHHTFVTASAGSFAIEMALAIQKLGGEGAALVPKGTNPKKQEKMRAFGMTVLEGGANFDQTDALGRQYAQEGDAQYVHPFARASNRAGTGILGLQLAEDCPEATNVILQYGGGSLLGGVAPVLKEIYASKKDQNVHITAVQVEGCSPFVDSVLSGNVREATDRTHRGKSFFSSLGGVGVGRVDPTTLAIGSQSIDNAVTVSRMEGYAAMYDYQQEHGLLPEFAAVPGLAYARKLARTPDVHNATIVTVLTGNDADIYVPGFLRGMSQRYAQSPRRVVHA